MYVGTPSACTTCVRQQEYSHQCRCMQHQWESDLYSSDRHPHTHIYICICIHTTGAPTKSQTSKEASAASALKPAQAKALDRALRMF